MSAETKNYRSFVNNKDNNKKIFNDLDLFKKELNKELNKKKYSNLFNSLFNSRYKKKLSNITNEYYNEIKKNILENFLKKLNIKKKTICNILNSNKLRN